MALAAWYNHGRPGGLMRDALQRWVDHVSDVAGLLR
jgi:hypothetical protein